MGVCRPLRPGAWVKRCISDRQNAGRIERSRIQTCRHTRTAHLNDASRISAANHSAPFTAKRFSRLETSVSIEIIFCGRTIDRTRHMSRPSIQIFRSPGETLPRSAINHQSVTFVYCIEKRRFAKNLRNGASDRLPQKIVHPLGRRMVCSSRKALFKRQAAPCPSRKTAVKNLGILETGPTSAERRPCCKIHAAVVIKDHALKRIAR